MQYYADHSEKYTEEQRYHLAVKLIERMKKKGRIETVVYGQQNLPEQGGYLLFSNHQGKYDALGIMSVHKNPCSVVMEKEKSNRYLTKQFIDLIGGKRLDRSDLRQQIKVFDAIAKEVMQGRRYLIFPEAGYTNNKNTLQEFYAGCFRTAHKARCSIVPVAIYDSYKPFGVNSLKKVVTEVHFLEPIPYQQLKELNTQQIRDLVVEKIAEKIEWLDASKRRNDTAYGKA